MRGLSFAWRRRGLRRSGGAGEPGFARGPHRTRSHTPGSRSVCTASGFAADSIRNGSYWHVRNVAVTSASALKGIDATPEPEWLAQTGSFPESPAFVPPDPQGQADLDDASAFDIADWTGPGQVSNRFDGDLPTHLAKINGQTDTLRHQALSVIPETPTWAMMVLGFGGLGAAGCLARRCRLPASAVETGGDRPHSPLDVRLRPVAAFRGLETPAAL